MFIVLFYKLISNNINYHKICALLENSGRSELITKFQPLFIIDMGMKQARQHLQFHIAD
jgi:hypothetical protein